MDLTKRPDHALASVPTLSRREREILDLLYRLGEGTVEDVRVELGSTSHYSTVRATLRVLEKKGHVCHKEALLRYVYSPVIPKRNATESALEHGVRRDGIRNTQFLKSFFNECSAAAYSTDKALGADIEFGRSKSVICGYRPAFLEPSSTTACCSRKHWAQVR